MTVLASIKKWVKSKPRLYFWYTKLRYGSRTAVRDWAMRTQAFLHEHDLNTFIFERDGIYVRIPTGQEFRYVPELMGGILGLEYASGFEADDLQAVLRLLPEDAVVLDVGANFGMYSIVIAAQRATARVHAFEPVRATAELLAANVRRNGVTERIRINNLAVGKEPGRLSITTDRHAGNYLVSGGVYSGEIEQVDVITLDSYAATHGLTRVDFIKCDVEGAELLVMKGGRQILEKLRPVVMLEIAEEWARRFGYSVDTLIDYMTGLGYSCKPVSACEVELEGAGSAKVMTHNYLFTPKAP